MVWSIVPRECVCGHGRQVVAAMATKESQDTYFLPKHHPPLKTMLCEIAAPTSFPFLRMSDTPQAGGEVEQGTNRPSFQFVLPSLVTMDAQSVTQQWSQLLREQLSDSVMWPGIHVTLQCPGCRRLAKQDGATRYVLVWQAAEIAVRTAGGISVHKKNVARLFCQPCFDRVAGDVEITRTPTRERVSHPARVALSMFPSAPCFERVEPFHKRVLDPAYEAVVIHVTRRMLRVYGALMGASRHREEMKFGRTKVMLVEQACAAQGCTRKGAADIALKGLPHGSLKKCAGCHSVYYCSPVCQRADWMAGHKAVCQAKQKGKEQEQRPAT